MTQDLPSRTNWRSYFGRGASMKIQHLHSPSNREPARHALSRAFVAIPLMMGMLFVVGISGCSTGSDSTQLQQLQSASTDFAQQASSLEHPQDASTDEATARAERFILTKQLLSVDAECSERLQAPYSNFVSSVSKSSSEQDTAYAAVLKAVSPCSAVTPYVPPHGPKSPPVKPGSDAIDVKPPAATASYVAVSSALNQYLSGLQSLASASDVASVQQAYGALSTTAASLASAVGAPKTVAPALTFADKAADIAIQQAQYEALNKIVAVVDPLLAQAAPTLITQMRLQQGYNLIVAANHASDIAALVTGDFTDPTLVNDKQWRLALFISLMEPLNDANTILLAMGKTDPATTITALVTAHHKLSDALASNTNQMGSILGSVQTLVQGGAAVLTAATPAIPSSK
jgi:hypothetical protein